MALASELMAVGMPASQARRVGIGAVTTVAKATGTTQADGAAILPGINIYTIVSSGKAGLLPSAETGGPVLIVNNGSNALLVFPRSGDSIAGAASANASFSVTNAKSCLFWPAGTTWVAVLSA